MRVTRGMFDEITEIPYEYTTRDDKEERLFKALEMSLKDQCPPDKADYLCMADEAEEQRCEECWMRWATRDFGTMKK